MPKKSKLYRAQAEKYDRASLYSLIDAVKVVKEMPHAKFDETVEIAFKLGVDPKQSDQNVRGAIPLPKGTGKKVVVAVIADDEPHRKDAREAGAEHVGYEEIIAKIKEGWLEFDVLIATPSAMTQVRTLGRQLGPRGLMPNPKTGTVTDKVGAAVAEAKAGRVEFRTDKGGCIQVPAGKVSFKPEDIAENCTAIIRAVLRAKPAASKGVYMQSCTISSTMSPGVRVDASALVKEVLA